MLAILVSILVFLRATLSLSIPTVEGNVWVEDPSAGFSIEQCTGGRVEGDNFFIPKQPNLDRNGPSCFNGHLRAERRYHNDYSSGVRQFGAAFRINSISDTRVSIKQIVDEQTNIPFFVLSAAKWGKLYASKGDQLLGFHVSNVGKLIRLNTVHDVEKRRYSLYIDGREIYRDDKAPRRGIFYDRIGAYITDKSPGAMNITWTHVRFWHK